MHPLFNVVRSVGRITAPPMRISGQGVHPSFIAEAAHPALGKVSVHLKVLSGKRIANELVTAVLGDTLGVRVPGCFAVEVDPSLDAEHACDGRRYCFASCIVPDGVTFAARAALANPRAAEEFFSSKEWQAIVLLDALVANSDRTPANLLFDANRRVWAIDHDTAFGGDWDAIDLQWPRYSTNLLARPGSPVPSEKQRSELMQEVESRPATLPVGQLTALLPTIGLLSDADAQALSLYIATRWRNLDALLRFALFSLS